jgi:Leucine-rich repeat (LRR) protein
MIIEGILPTELGLLTTLEVLDFSENQATGKIPSEFVLLTSLTIVDFRKFLSVS